MNIQNITQVQNIIALILAVIFCTVSTQQKSHAAIPDRLNHVRALSLYNITNPPSGVSYRPFQADKFWVKSDTAPPVFSYFLYNDMGLTDVPITFRGQTYHENMLQLTQIAFQKWATSLGYKVRQVTNFGQANMLILLRDSSGYDPTIVGRAHILLEPYKMGTIEIFKDGLGDFGQRADYEKIKNIFVNKTDEYALRSLIEETLVHEIGHLVGFAHADNIANSGYVPITDRFPAAEVPSMMGGYDHFQLLRDSLGRDISYDDFKPAVQEIYSYKLINSCDSPVGANSSIITKSNCQQYFGLMYRFLNK